MNVRRSLLAAAALLTSLAGCASAPSSNATRADIDRVLDALHERASKAEGEAYFELYTPDAVFLGTDATERWTLEEFKAYASPHFGAGNGWTYTVTERHVSFNTTRTAAWFDERLENAKLGECRGTGVLTLGSDAVWRIEQYNLTVPVPNELVVELADRIRSMGE